MTALFTVHHLGVSQSERVVWVCEELGLPYELDIYARDPESRMAPADYKVLHPMGTAPVLTDGDKVFSESGAIVEYIVAKYGKGQLAPSPDADNFADYLFWFHFSNGTLTSTEMLAMGAAFLGAPADPFFELHNLSADPEERENLMSTRADVASTMRSVLDAQRDAKRKLPTLRNGA